MDEEDQFFKDINTLYQRQKVLFQKCCEQLKDIYLVKSIVIHFSLGQRFSTSGSRNLLSDRRNLIYSYTCFDLQLEVGHHQFNVENQYSWPVVLNFFFGVPLRLFLRTKSAVNSL